MPHVVVVDTSVLFNPEKKFAACPDFDAFWEEHANASKLELVVPEVVRGELLFQQTTSALNSLQKVTDELRKVSEVSAHSHLHKISEASVRSQVAGKIDGWIQKKGGLLCPTPIGLIDWTEIIDRSIWRKAPFGPDVKDRESEKGFRDAMILETLVQFCATERRRVRIAFVCKDGLLKGAAEDRLSGEARCACYGSLEDLGSVLKMTRERLTDQFVDQVLAKARRVFYSKDDPECLYKSEEIPSLARRTYRDFFEHPDRDLSFDALTPLLYGGGPWTALSSKWFIQNTQFSQLEVGHRYHWSTEVKWMKGYQGQTYFFGLTGIGQPQICHRVRSLAFDVKWSAHVADDGKFTAAARDSVELVRASFDEVSEEELARLGL